MSTIVNHPHRESGQHGVARPLPPPPLVHHVSDEARRADAWDEMLEQWIAEVRIGRTEAGD